MMHNPKFLQFLPLLLTFFLCFFLDKINTEIGESHEEEDDFESLFERDEENQKSELNEETNKESLTPQQETTLAPHQITPLSELLSTKPKPKPTDGIDSFSVTTPEEDVFFDDDEFEGFPADSQKTASSQEKTEANQPKSSSQREASQQVAESSSEDKKKALTAEKKRSIRNYIVELVYIGFIFIYGLNYLWGSSKNSAIANAWWKEVSTQYKANFSFVGQFTRESQSEYRITAAGRLHCHFLHAHLMLRKRQDLFSVLRDFFHGKKDTLTIDIAMHEDCMEPFIFALVPKKEERNIRKENPDLARFCTKSTGSDYTSATLAAAGDLSVTHCVLTDAEELEVVFLHHEVLTTLNKYLPFLHSFHFTDQFRHSQHKKVISFVFHIPNNPKEIQKISTLMRMVLHFVDLIANTKLPKHRKARAEKERAKVIEAKEKLSHAQRQEAAQQRKLSKKQKEEEKLDVLGPEAQRKKEMREQKKANRKKFQPKFKALYA